MATKYIFFDLGKVILDFDRATTNEQLAAITQLPSQRIGEIIFDSGLEDDFETGTIDQAEFHRRFCDATGCSVAAEQLLEVCSDIFTLNISIVPLIAQLTAVGYPIGILSNTCSAHWEHVFGQYTFLRQNFRDYILSYESRSMKPEKKIYADAIEATGCQGSEVFFVDDRQENVDGALAAGMDAVLYESAKKLIQDLQHRGVSFNL